MNKSQIIMALGCIGLALGVGIGAFGAHGLKAILMENGRIDTFETAVKYHMYHMIGLLVLGVWCNQREVRAEWISALFVIGTVIFSGSLYILSVTNITWLGAVTPVGGVFFIAGWLIWAFFILKKK